MSEGYGQTAELNQSEVINHATPERRVTLRLNGPFPAKARVVGRDGNIFKVNTAVENISAGGLYLQLEQLVEPGEVLFVVTEFSKAWTRKARTACVATRGPVLRVDPRPGGEYGVAVAIEHHRFLPGGVGSTGAAF